MMTRRLLIWFSNTNLYSNIILKFIPFIRFSLYYTPLRGNQYNEAYYILKAGDFIVCRDSKKLTAILIGGDWTHAVLCLGKKYEGAEFECAEMTHHDFTKSDFFDIAKESSDFAIYRCDDFDKEYVPKIVEKCKTFEVAKCDVGFELGVRALYCSELVYQSDFEHRAQFNLADLRSLGQKYISPTGLTKAPNVRCVYDSRNTKPRY